MSLTKLSHAFMNGKACMRCGITKYKAREKGQDHCKEQWILTVVVENEEAEKLQKLAEYRQLNSSECVRRWIRSSRPGGSGWKPPYEKKS